jgi:acetolactate synthase small subunit
MRDFAIPLTHRPGELARIAHALARKSVNIKSVAAMAVQHQGLMHVIIEDVEAARSALREGNIPFEESEVVTVLLENQAGQLEDVAAKLSNAGVNLLAAYVVGLDGDLVELALIADDPKKAKKAVG